MRILDWVVIACLICLMAALSSQQAEIKRMKRSDVEQKNIIMGLAEFHDWGKND